MKIKNRFECAYCGREIEFGDSEAREYNNALFCDEACATRYAGIPYYDWRFDSEYDILIDASNGYGITIIGDNWFSNGMCSDGMYMIFDKLDETKFEFDEDYDEYFCVKRGNDTPSIQRFLNIFEEHKDDFVTLKLGDCDTYEMRSHRDDTFDKILGIYVNSEIRKFVFKYIANDIDPDEFKAFVHEDGLYIECNGKKAIIMKSLDPEYYPEKFEKRKDSYVE